MKEFNLKSFQDWFNKNYSWDEKTEEEREALPEYQDDYRLDGGWFPEDGEYGMYKQGYEIGQLVFEEGIDLLPEVFDQKFPGLIMKEDLFECTKSRFNDPCILLPFKREYIPIFEYIASEFCEAKPKISLKEYLEED